MRIGLLTSGGDAPGMNAAIRSIVRTALYRGSEAIGVRGGYSGLFERDFVDLDIPSVGDIIHRGGTILGTSRSEYFTTDEGRDVAFRVLDGYVDALIVIGGDGSMRGALELADRGLKVITIPGTIDNDIGYQEESIGFFTAVSTVTEAIGKIRDTSSAHNRANVIEVMGRNCGDLALYAGVAGGAESIIIPEVPMDLDKVVAKVCHGRDRGKRHHIILVTEGRDAQSITETIEERTGVETRLTTLGYLQRGGDPDVRDRINATLLGKEAVERLLQGEGQGGLALGIKGGLPLAMDLREALNVEKEFRRDLYDAMEMISF
ncbi:MAG: ATP-dependent 6-phosphofructokinase [Tissierellia bacterium]|nr:ATP-dependent 6-phosphofructokinase [Tissierellia bacterium]